MPFPDKELDLWRCTEGHRARGVQGVDRALREAEEASKFAASSRTRRPRRPSRASQLLVASSTTFPVEEEVLLQEAPDDYSVELLWLDGRDLLDPHFFANPWPFQEQAAEWATGGLGREYLESCD